MTKPALFADDVEPMPGAAPEKWVLMYSSSIEHYDNESMMPGIYGYDYDRNRGPSCSMGGHVEPIFFDTREEAERELANREPIGGVGCYRVWSMDQYLRRKETCDFYG